MSKLPGTNKLGLEFPIVFKWQSGITDYLREPQDWLKISSLGITSYFTPDGIGGQTLDGSVHTSKQGTVSLRDGDYVIQTSWGYKAVVRPSDRNWIRYALGPIYNDSPKELSLVMKELHPTVKYSPFDLSDLDEYGKWKLEQDDIQDRREADEEDKKWAERSRKARIRLMKEDDEI